MKKGAFLILALLTVVFFQPDYSFAQSAGQEEVIELGTTEIKIKIETPQVKLYSSRIKPEFDDVHLEKSFRQEITGLGETFEIKNSSTKELTTRIEINKVLTKLR